MMISVGLLLVLARVRLITVYCLSTGGLGGTMVGRLSLLRRRGSVRVRGRFAAKFKNKYSSSYAWYDLVYRSVFGSPCVSKWGECKCSKSDAMHDHGDGKWTEPSGLELSGVDDSCTS